MYVGKYEGKDCVVHPTAPNYSVLITGISGSGKSCRQNQIELNEVVNGNTVIILDVSKSRRKEIVFQNIRQEYWDNVNYINPAEEGLGLDILSPIGRDKEEQEPYINLVNENVRVLSACQRMGVTQQAVLRVAIEECIKKKSQRPEADCRTLIRETFYDHKKEEKWQEVYQKLWTILNCKVLDGEKGKIQPRKINLLDLSSLDMLSGQIISEMILSYLWRNCYYGYASEEYGKMIFSLDEFQHFSMKQDATLRIMLREGRKFGVSLILATQTLDVFAKESLSLINQASTHIYFRPAASDLARCAKQIDISNAGRWKQRLSDLERGESIAAGVFDINGIIIRHPIRLR